MSQDSRSPRSPWLVVGGLAALFLVGGTFWWSMRGPASSDPSSVPLAVNESSLNANASDPHSTPLALRAPASVGAPTGAGANAGALPGPISGSVSASVSPSSTSFKTDVKGTGGNFAPATTPGNPNLVSGSAVPKAPVVEVPKDSCVSLAFKAASGKDVVQYSKNVIKIPDERMNPKTLCVKVDGVPVNYKVISEKTREISLGAVNKPNSIVTVRYCFGKASCKENCVVPRDEFMEALAGTDGDAEEAAPQVGWTGNKDESATEKNVERELASFKDVTEDRKAGAYTQWTPSDTTEACGMSAENLQQARLGH